MDMLYGKEILIRKLVTSEFGFRNILYLKLTYFLYIVYIRKD